MWSLIIPGVVAFHFRGLRVLGKSRFYAGNASHYQEGRYVGKTVKNIFGQPNHYNSHGTPVGFSRKIRRTKAIHYDGKMGKPIGWSRCFWVIWFHKSKKGGYFYV